MREKFRQFMIGRYGTDGLNQFLSMSSIVMLLVSLLTRVSLFTWLGAALLILCYYRSPIRDHISEHGGSAFFDELGAAARAGDLDATASPGHPQLLAALRAAVVVVQLAVGPLLLQAAELIIEPILQAVKAVVLLGALGDIAAQAAVVAQNQQRRGTQFIKKS